VSALVLWTWIGRKSGRDMNYASDLLLWLIVPGIIGARLAFVIANFKDFMAKPELILRIDLGGLIFYGGLLGGIVGLYLFARKKRESFSDVADFTVVAVPLAHALGRAGCFLNGCCYGKIWHGPLAVRYPCPHNGHPGGLAWFDHVRAGLITSYDSYSLPVHPVQLYESAANFLIFLILLYSYHRRKFTGEITALYLLLYPSARFVLEFFRGDERMKFFSLSVAQWLSCVLFLSGLVLMLVLKTKYAQNRTSSSR
jgi:phosphatidylglycerol:prolipoprotein diacylglycerol transferase